MEPTPSTSSAHSFRVDQTTESLNAPFPLKYAPTFYPNEQQFSDPIKFVRSIAHIGQKTGQKEGNRSTLDDEQIDTDQWKSISHQQTLSCAPLFHPIIQVFARLCHHRHG